MPVNTGVRILETTHVFSLFTREERERGGIPPSLRWPGQGYLPPFAPGQDKGTLPPLPSQDRGTLLSLASPQTGQGYPPSFPSPPVAKIGVPSLSSPARTGVSSLASPLPQVQGQDSCAVRVICYICYCSWGNFKRYIIT